MPCSRSLGLERAPRPERGLADRGGRSRSRRHGLTIVEVAVALGVLAILLTGVFSALMTASLASTTARESQAASEEALRQIDRYASQQAFDSIASATEHFEVLYKTGQVDVAGAPVTTRLLAAPDSVFPRPADAQSPPRAGYLSVARVPGNPDLLQLQVTVAWRSVDGQVHRVDLVTRKAR